MAKNILASQSERESIFRIKFFQNEIAAEIVNVWYSDACTEHMFSFTCISSGSN